MYDQFEEENFPVGRRILGDSVGLQEKLVVAVIQTEF
jgi:hypothetical protein